MSLPAPCTQASRIVRSCPCVGTHLPRPAPRPHKHPRPPARRARPPHAARCMRPLPCTPAPAHHAPVRARPRSCTHRAAPVSRTRRARTPRTCRARWRTRRNFVPAPARTLMRRARARTRVCAVPAGARREREPICAHVPRVRTVGRLHAPCPPPRMRCLPSTAPTAYASCSHPTYVPRAVPSPLPRACAACRHVRTCLAARGARLRPRTRRGRPCPRACAAPAYAARARTCVRAVPAGARRKRERMCTCRAYAPFAHAPPPHTAPTPPCPQTRAASRHVRTCLPARGARLRPCTHRAVACPRARVPALLARAPAYAPCTPPHTSRLPPHVRTCACAHVRAVIAAAPAHAPRPRTRTLLARAPAYVPCPQARAAGSARAVPGGARREREGMYAYAQCPPSRKRRPRAQRPRPCTLARRARACIRVRVCVVPYVPRTGM
ncbi:hypothetical protein GGX14DRAFT_575927 [Mycena pura]|uniref:Uncharacterized protein n=1 Tax=Mycena pura TaxID=153505 RepID=A0AAD6UY19_9AGAR|nr:hypothetical protein GGX14DRAFT_575927 [Mycena pura]